MRRAGQAMHGRAERQPRRDEAPRAALRPAEPGLVCAAVAEVVTPIAAASGVSLDHVEFHGAGRRGLLQVFLDKDGGVSVEDCANVSRQLAALLDQLTDEPGSAVARAGLTGAYTLEVSSPGLTRPLHDAADIARHVGNLVHLACRVPVIRGDYQVVGRLVGLEDGDVVVDAGGSDGVVRVPLDKVKKARLEIEDQ